MFKMAKKPMYRLKNGPQNLQHRNTEMQADFSEKDILCLIFCEKTLSREFHLNGSTLECSIWEMSKIFILSNRPFLGPSPLFNIASS